MSKMLQQQYSILDTKAEAFQIPFYIQNQAMAVRIFTDCVNNPDHVMGKNPSDYKLYHLGEFNVEDGNHTINDSPNHISNGESLVR